MSDDRRVAVPDLREKPRKRVVHEFLLTHSAIGKNSYQSRDLSLSGVFIEGTFPGVNPGDTMDVEFVTASDPATTHRFAASVARIADDGIGLKFLSLDMDTYGALLDLTLTG